MPLTIKRRVIVTITTIFFTSTMFMGFFTYHSQMNQLRDSLKDMAKNGNALFQNILAADAEGLARAHAGLDRLEMLLKPFAGKRRDELLNAATPIFDDLRKNNNITHMYFIEPDGTVFLRVHKPQQFGDKLNRATYKMAAETGKTSSGLEMGLNFFSLRCVRPVSYGGKSIGFIEVAEEIDHVFGHMKAITGNDFSLFLTEDFLGKYRMDFGTERIGNYSILYPTDKKVSLQLAAKLLDTMQKGGNEHSVSLIDLDGAKYAVGIGPVKDAFGAPAGILFSQREVSPRYVVMWKGIILSVSIFVAIFLGSSVLFYFSLKKSLLLFDALRENILTVTRTWDLTERLEVDTRDEIGELATDFNLMKEQIRKLQEKLEARAEELAAVNQELEAFNYTVSHDLRRPLTVINGYVQVVMDLYGETLEEDCRKSLNEIYQASVRMNQLLDALLEFSLVKSAELSREPVDLSAMAQTLAAELMLKEPGRRVRFIIQEGITVNGGGILKSVMENLLGNAWKYTGEQDEAIIEFGKKEIEGETVCFVRDNGIGFPMEYADQLFVPFQRLPGTDKFKGHGIGLATVARIVRRQGGRVWAESQPGKGATFYFTVKD